MGKFSKHLGEEQEIEIEGEKFFLKPLTTEQLPDFFKVIKCFSGAQDGGTVEDMTKNMSEEGLRSVQRIIDATLEKSYPKEDEEERKQFGLKYMSILLSKIFEINSASAKEEAPSKIKDKISKLKEANESTPKTQAENPL